MKEFFANMSYTIGQDYKAKNKIIHPFSASPKEIIENRYADFRESWEGCEKSMRALQWPKSKMIAELKTCLGGQALNLIRSFPNVDETYDAALALLDTNFKHSSAGVKNIVQHLLDSKPMQSTSHTEFLKLQNLLCSTNINIQRLNIDNETLAQLVFMAFMEQKLAPETAKRWHRHAARYVERENERTGAQSEFTPVPLSEFTQFVLQETQTAMLELTAGYAKDKKDDKKQKNVALPAAKAQPQPQQQQQAAPAQAGRQVRSCPECGKNHPLYQCKDAKGKGAEHMLKMAIKGKICPRCLNHPKDHGCDFKCETCGMPHNVLVHMPHNEFLRLTGNNQPRPQNQQAQQNRQGQQGQRGQQRRQQRGNGRANAVNQQQPQGNQAIVPQFQAFVPNFAAPPPGMYLQQPAVVQHVQGAQAQALLPPQQFPALMPPQGAQEPGKQNQMQKKNVNLVSGHAIEQFTRGKFACSNQLNPESQPVLRTALCYAVTEDNLQRKIRVFLDSGADVNLLREKVAKELNLSGPKTNLELSLASGRRQSISSLKSSLTLKSLDGRSELKIQVNTTPVVCPALAPIQSLDLANNPHMQGVFFADDFDEDRPVDLLLGEPFCSYICEGPMVLPNPAGIGYQPTSFGNVVIGMQGPRLSEEVMMASKTGVPHTSFLVLYQKE